MRILKKEKEAGTRNTEERRANGVQDSDNDSSDEGGEEQCGICGHQPDDPHIIKVRGCEHKFCKICIESYATMVIAKGEKVCLPS